MSKACELITAHRVLNTFVYDNLRLPPADKGLLMAINRIKASNIESGGVLAVRDLLYHSMRLCIDDLTIGLGQAEAQYRAGVSHQLKRFKL